MNRLKICRASAGSGKTFTLTTEYISLLVQRPDNYSHILAVTFTNKATNEMKSRIVSTLDGIAHSDPSSDNYLKAIMERLAKDGLQMKEQDVRERCRQALSLILHDYSRFHVMTIDSFFQSVIRELARELNLTANLRVDLNQDEALEDAVKRMIDNMKRGDEVYNAVLVFVQEKMTAKNATNWKINDAVVSFSKNIFNETYLKQEANIREATKGDRFFMRHRKMLEEQQAEWNDRRFATARAFINYCELEGFTSAHFVKGLRGIYPFMDRLSKGEIPNLTDTVKSFASSPWLKDAKSNERHSPQFRLWLSDIITAYTKFNTIDAMQRHLSQMSLLGSVDKTLRDLNEEANRFILADTAYMLNQIISDKDVPFIYEKTAAVFKYIMIDEFQDTSELQWNNFMPLIAESLAAGNMCLLVGDVKQSIYRWRNSDWSILNNIGESRFAKYIEEAPLTTNYRSAGNVIAFNNAFFTRASEAIVGRFDKMFPGSSLTTSLRKAYSDVSQNIPEKKLDQGFVSIIDINGEEKTQGKADGEGNSKAEENVDAQEKSDLPTPTYDETMLEAVADTIDDLERRDVNVNDMVILLRSNTNLQRVSAYLKQMRPDINLVSSEAFQLCSSPAIQLLVLALQSIADTDNEFIVRTLAYKYQEQILHNPTIIGFPHRVYQADQDTLRRLLPDGFLDSLDELQVFPLYELCERITDLFRLTDIPAQSAFLFSFFDHLSAYIQDHSADLDSFITYWEEQLQTKNIPAGSVDGLRLMTIHKSKGLEFHTVILPYCDWDMNGRPGILWCKRPTDDQLPADSSDTRLPINAVDFKKDLIDTDFRADYEEEVLKNYVDNLNIMYVAFTRASQNLVVLTGKRPRTEFTCHDIIEAATKLISDDIHLPFGQISPSETTSTKHDETTLPITFRSAPLNAHFLQSNKSREFVEEDLDEVQSVPDDSVACPKTSNPKPKTQNPKPQTYIKKGLLMHKALESIHNLDDIPRALLALDQEGVFQSEEQKAEVGEQIKKALDNPQARQWFAPDWTVINECNILSLDKNDLPQVKRPDRVISNDTATIVIDYKTGRELPKHHIQVRQYIQLLRQMNYPNVQGFLWYLTLDKVVPVSQEPLIDQDS